MRVRYKIKKFKVEAGQILYYLGNQGQGLQYCVFRVEEIEPSGRVILMTANGSKIPHTEANLLGWKVRWRLATEEEKKFFTDSIYNR